MSITLYYVSGSPFSWKVWLALEHKRVGYATESLSRDRGDLSAPAFARLNPRRRVPVLRDGELVLYESNAIVEYLQDAYPDGPSLWPTDVRDRAFARRFAGEADAYLYPVVRQLAEEILFDPRRSPDVARVGRALGGLEAELAILQPAMRGPFVAGDGPSVADYALYPLTAFLGRIDRRRHDLGVLASVEPATSSWMQRVEALPFFARTVPPHWRRP